MKPQNLGRFNREYMEISVKSNINELLAAMEKYKRDVVEKAVPRALNKVADQVKTNAARQIRDAGYKIKISDIKTNLQVKYATTTRLTASVIVKGKPIALIKYGARQTRKGVSVDVLKGRKVIAGAFIATMPNGHRGVFVRVGTKHVKKIKAGRIFWSQLPIKELFGPSVPSAIANAQVQDAIERLIRTKFPEVFRQQLDYLSTLG